MAAQVESAIDLQPHGHFAREASASPRHNDAEALDKLENPAKVSRALWILTGGTLLVVAALLVVGFFVRKPVELSELSSLATNLDRDYDVRAVRTSSSNGGQPILSVEVFLPIDRWGGGTRPNESESAVTSTRRSRAVSRIWGRYQKVQVVTLSGFNLGIASLSLKDG